ERCRVAASGEVLTSFTLTWTVTASCQRIESNSRLCENPHVVCSRRTWLGPGALGSAHRSQGKAPRIEDAAHRADPIEAPAQFVRVSVPCDDSLGGMPVVRRSRPWVFLLVCLDGSGPVF